MSNKLQRAVYRIVICMTFFALIPPSWADAAAEVLQPHESKPLPSAILRWGITPIFFELKCLEGECPKKKRDLVVQKISSSLDSAPQFLQQTKVEMLTWTELEPGKKPGGRATVQWNSIDISSTIDGPFERLLVHEIAHLFDETDHRLGSEFLKIRYSSKEYQDLLSMLWQHIRSINEPRDLSNLDQKVTDILTQNKMLRRGPKDIHASDVYEYWAVAVELFYAYNKDPKLIELDEVLDKREIEFFSRLKW